MQENIAVSSGWSQDVYIRAFHFAARAHQGQLYPGTALPYIIHISLVTMEIIATLEVEQVNQPDLAVQYALLHDVLEDTRVTGEKIKEEFGENVALGVSALTKDKKMEDPLSESLNRIQNQPTEVQMVKLADRITNLQQPPFYWSESKKRSYWEDALKIHAVLKSASSYLEKRLAQKIEVYPQYFK